MIETLTWMLERMKVLVEPSGAAAAAAVRHRKADFSGKRVGVVLSGGNVDLQKLAGYIGSPARPLSFLKRDRRRPASGRNGGVNAWPSIAASLIALVSGRRVPAPRGKPLLGATGPARARAEQGDRGRETGSRTSRSRTRPGKAVRLSQFRGEPVAVTFAYTRCPDAAACPMTMAKFSKLNAAIAGKEVGRLLVVTVDPETDTPAVLADFATTDRRRPRALEVPDGRSARARAGGRDLRRPLLSRARPDHAPAGGGGHRPGRPARVDHYGADWEPEQILQELQKARKG